MKSQELDQNFQSLVIRYLSGNASDEEVRDLESSVADSAANKQQFAEMKKAWMLSGMAKDAQVVDVDKAWQNTSRQLGESQVVKMPVKTGRRWMTIAASLIILAVASFLLFQQFGDSTAMAMTTTSSEKSFDLSDGSHISLNQASSLTYLLAEKEQVRKVNLIGDAFFDVARDEQKPFIIETKHLEIEVLGTSFYVDARDDENQVQVIVESGKVAVRANGNETILTANEKIVLNKDKGSFIKAKNNDANFTSIKTKTLIFENSSLQEVAFALNRQFNVDIKFKDPKLAQCPLTSTFKDKSLDAILAIIQSTLSINVRQTQNQIIFEGNCTLE